MKAKHSNPGMIRRTKRQPENESDILVNMLHVNNFIQDSKQIDREILATYDRFADRRSSN